MYDSCICNVWLCVAWLFPSSCLMLVTLFDLFVHVGRICIPPLQNHLVWSNSFPCAHLLMYLRYFWAIIFWFVFYSTRLHILLLVRSWPLIVLCLSTLPAIKWSQVLGTDIFGASPSHHHAILERGRHIIMPCWRRLPHHHDILEETSTSSYLAIPSCHLRGHCHIITLATTSPFIKDCLMHRFIITWSPIIEDHYSKKLN